MKKLICILLSALTLFAFTACEFRVKKGEIATAEDINEFLSDVEEYHSMTEEDFGITFTYTLENEEIGYYGSNSTNVKITGKASYSNGQLEDIQYKGTETDKETSHTAGGKEKDVYKITEEVVGLDVNEEDPVYYVKYKLTNKTSYGEEKYSVKVKSAYRNEVELFGYIPTFDAVISKIKNSLKDIASYVVYFDGDDFVAISSIYGKKNPSKTTLTVIADGDWIEAVKIETESYNEKSVLEIKVKDSVEIKKPSKARDYENIDKE